MYIYTHINHILHNENEEMEKKDKSLPADLILAQNDIHNFYAIINVIHIHVWC